MNEATVLQAAADILEERGKTIGNAIHPYTGKVDLWGALCLAGGAKPDDLEDDIEEAQRYVPTANLRAVVGSYELVSEFVGREAGEWGDEEDLDSMVYILRHLGYQVQLTQ